MKFYKNCRARVTSLLLLPFYSLFPFFFFSPLFCSVPFVKRNSGPLHLKKNKKIQIFIPLKHYFVSKITKIVTKKFWNPGQRWREKSFCPKKKKKRMIYHLISFFHSYMSFQTTESYYLVFRSQTNKSLFDFFSSVFFFTCCLVFRTKFLNMQFWKKKEKNPAESLWEALLESGEGGGRKNKVGKRT